MHTDTVDESFWIINIMHVANVVLKQPRYSYCKKVFLSKLSYIVSLYRQKVRIQDQNFSSYLV